MLPYSILRVSGSGYLAEDEHLLLKVSVEGLRVVDEVAQHFGVGGGPRCPGSAGKRTCRSGGPLVTPVGVDVGNLPDPYGLLGVLLAHG